MASSSVSQDDFENDFEKLERRSRIRTARARQINPQSCRIESTLERLPPIGIEIEDNMEQPYIDTATISPYSVVEGDTSPKPVARNREAKISSDKRPAKLHHNNKGKNQRDRRKLREKRRSTGVVHLASTESTGGSTSGEEEEFTEIMGGETKRNTLHNESIPQDVQQLSSPPVEIPERKNSGHNKHQSPLYSRLRLRGDKSPRSEDLEADDEQGDKTDNDHDSLNLSESSSVTSLVAAGSGATSTGSGLLVESTINSSNSTPVVRSTTPTMAIPASNSTPVIRSTTPTIPSTNSTPVLRPTTPTTVMDSILSPEERDRCLEENRHLVSLMEEKDRRIQYLELKIQQLTVDTQGLVEEYSRIREENATLIKTVGNLSK